MKLFIFGAVASLLFSSANAQQQSICTQQFSNISVPVTASTTIVAETKDIVTDIMNVTGLTAGFDVQAAKIPNAAAVIYNGKRYLLFNPAFIQQLNQVTGNDWASVSVLAHEIGHHLNGHTLSATGSQPDKELEADEFSGYIMQRLGATLEEAQMAMNLAADIKGTITHPGRTDRLVAVEKGWNKASDQLASDIEENEQPTTTQAAPAVKAQPVKNTISPATVVTNKTIFNKKDIIGNIRFDADQTGQYYLTIQGDVVAIKDNRVFLLGKMVSTSSNEYPFIIRGKTDSLYVNNNGTIFTADKRKAGIITDYQ